MSCLKIKHQKKSVLIIILISLGIFYPLIEGQVFLLNNKEDASKNASKVQGLDLNQAQFDQDSILKWKEQYLKADKNENGISDALETRLKDSAEVSSFNEKSSENKKNRVMTNDILNSQHQTPEQIPLDNIPIIVLFPEGDFSSNSLFFEELGGSIKSTYDIAINGFAGSTSQNTLNEFCDSLREQNIPFFIEEDRIYQAQLYYAGRNMNLRPYVWNTLAYDGDQYSSIAIIDTGVDDSHNFFSPGYPSKIVGWRDEVNLLSSPYDDNGHGSHTSGIASGIGTPSYDGSGRTVATAAYEFDNTGGISGIGTYVYDWTRFNVTDPGLIELFCEFDDFTPGPDDTDLWVHLYYGNTMVDSYEVGSDSWFHTLSYIATSSSLGTYSFRLTMTLLDFTGDGYVSDFKIRFRSEIHWPFDPPQFGSGDPWKGVAPDANLVGVKVLDQYGSGWTSDIIAGINWVITNKMVYNITTMSLSLGGGSGDTAMINAVNTAVENGIVTVVSAGNSGPGYNAIGSPRDADNVITVAAMSIDDQTTDYSSQGGPSYTGNTVKPDITAPGGSFNNLQMFSTDTNYNDASGAYPIDGYANDLDGAQGTSMSAPAVAGASNLLIEAMGGHQSWGYTATEAKRVKALLLMSATETYPLLRETFSTSYSPLLNRGGKDVHEGYGRLNVDVAIEAYTQELTLGSQFNAWITSSLVNPFNKHGLGCYANLISGQNYVFTLDVPSGADFDLHLYSDNPSSIGEPIMVASSTSTGLGTDELISYTATSTGKYYLIAKVISGEGNAIISYPIIDHDLSVSLEVPSSPDIGNMYIVNATVFNNGNYDESNVDLFLYLDTILVDSTTISTLSVGASQTINYVWSPTVFTTYNFTTYAPPIPSETIIVNNIATKLITISSLNNYIMVPDYTYTWIDASGGTELFLGDDDYAAITLPFNFQFYNDTFSTVYVSSNGWLSFVNPTPYELSNIPFPTGLPEYHYMIAPFWDDLQPASGGGSGNIYVQSFGTYWVIEYANILHYGSPTVGTFEVVLYETGEIVFNYDYISYIGGGYTCGLNLGVDTQYYNLYQGLNDLTDNFAIQFTTELGVLDHDLSVSLEVPSSPDIGNMYSVNATVFNDGDYDELNVELFLYLDTVLVDSTTIPTLPIGASETINYMWTPPDYGTYNFTAYSPPVPGETFTGNNFVTEIIQIVDTELFDGMYIEHIFTSDAPYPSTFSYAPYSGALWYETWDVPSVFVGTWTVDAQTRIMSVGSVFGDGTHTPAWIFTDINLGDTIPIAVDGVGDHSFLVSNELVYDLPGFGLIEVWELVDLDAFGGIAWYEKSTGILLNGTFAFSGTSYTFDFVDTNVAFSYITLDHDLKVSLEVPSSPDLGEPYLINATVFNNGINDEFNVDFFLYLDTVLIDSTTISTLPVGASETINYMWIPPDYGTYNFTAYAPPVSSETYSFNNRITKLISIRKTIFFEDFESGLSKWETITGLWHLTDDTSIWSDPYHSPTHSMWFGDESTGTFATGLQEYGELVSYPIDLSSYEDASLEFYHWRAGEGGSFDVSYVYISIDGINWDLLYQSSSAYIAPWEQVSLDISGYVGNPSVQLRFNFDTLDEFNNDFRGWLVDDIEILGIPSLTITTPDSTSVWETGTSQSITWSSTGSSSDVKLELYENDVLVMEIVANTPNDGEFSWAIPSDLTDSTLYQIKITDAANPATDDFSDYFEIFTIIPDTLTITSPDSTSVWETGTSHAITWTSTGSLTDVKLELYKDDVFVIEIIASTTNDGSYSWALPTTLGDSTQYQIKITDAANPATDDFSDYFEIFTSPVVSDTITVTNPDSLTAWETGTTHSITWTPTGSITNVKIELYKDGVFEREIVASTANDGSYNWTIPTDLEDGIDYQIRISDVSNPTTYDDSSNFALTSLPISTTPGIPGYNLYFLIGIICVASGILVKKRKKLRTT